MPAMSTRVSARPSSATASSRWEDLAVCQEERLPNVDNVHTRLVAAGASRFCDPFA
jgi:hypothetical protein